MTKKASPKVAPEHDFQALYQRALADAENLRKRFEDERKLVAKFAIGEVVLDLVPVLENFTRATEHLPEDQKDSPWTTGILYIRKQLMEVLSQRGVVELTAKPGDAFDANLHEAIGTVTNPDQTEDTIAEVKGMGYQLHERVLKPVPVIVNIQETKKEE